MIVALTLGHFVAGVLLGTRFRVIVLAPAMLLSIVGLATATGLAGGGLGEAVVAVLAALAALQIGFLAGAALRDRRIAPLPHRSAPPEGGLATGAPAPAALGPHGPIEPRRHANQPVSG